MTMAARARLRVCVGLSIALIVAVWGTAGAGAVAADSPTITPSRFGVVTHIATRFGIYGQENQPMDIAAGTGAGWIREEIRWDWIQHPVGTDDWGFTDEMVRDAQSHNLQILGLLGYNNSAQQAGVVDYGMPDIGLWKNFVADAVNHYKGQIRAWEVWNEPDVPYFWQGSVADYLALLRETYATIKAIDPTATVLNGACANLDLRWFTDFLDQGGAQYADALAFHPYVMKSSLDNGDYQKLDLAHFREIEQRTGKGWWFTEIGWSSATAGGDYGGGVGSERAQASYMIRQYVMSLAYPGLDVAHIFWYNFRDDGTDASNAEHNYGLIKSDWRTPKVAYLAYQQMTQRLGGANRQDSFASGAGTAYRFDRNGTTVDVVWGGGRTNLPTTAAQARAYDMVGNALAAEVSGGQIHVDIGADPVFVEHSGAASSPPVQAQAPATSTFTLPPQNPGNVPGIAGRR